MAFVDRAQVIFKAGDGGDGIVSFRHEKFRARGGPDGGDGGHGGDIILIASRNQNTLANFRYQKLVKAESGQKGDRAKRHGKSGHDFEVPVPVGTTVIAGDQVLADLTHDGQKELIANGGQGGFGNAHFVSSTRQAPQVAEKGEKGQQLETTLELKMIADVGIIGLPNAGKSTLLSVISNARPEIADYPFTTLAPNLGVVDVDKKTSLLFADIPGLIEGASHGRGLGDEFLRHIERTSVLVHLIDAYNENVKTAYKTIMQELQDYKIDLSHKPQIVALTKTEGLDKKELAKYVKILKSLVPKGAPVMAISSASQEGVKELLRTTVKRVEAMRKSAEKSSPAKKELPVIGLRADNNAWQVQKTDNGFIITGQKIERFAERTDFQNEHAVARLHDIMHKMGIAGELHRQGVTPGQKIQIGQSPDTHLVY